MKHFFILVFVFVFTQANSQLSISGTDMAPDVNHMLRYHLNFTTSEDSHSYVEWFRMVGLDADQIKRSDVDGPSTNHHFTLIGFVAEETYAFRIHAWNSDHLKVSTWVQFTTGSLPADQTYADSVSVVNPDLTGYFMTNTVGVPDPTFQMYNRAGEVVWYDYHGGEPANGQLTQCRMWDIDENGHTMSLECHELTERDLYGNVIAHVDFTGTSYENLFFHHDVIKNSDGNYVAIAAELKYFDFSGIGGNANQGVVGEHLLEFDAAGNVLWDWSGFDHFDPLTATNTNGYWLPVFGAGKFNWWHSNALHQDYDGNYLLSCKEIDQMMKINRETDEIMWQISGADATIPFNDATHTGDQHDLNDIGGGKYIVFDNTGLGTQSRVMEFQIVDYDEPIAFKTWEYVLPTAWFSNILGTARRMPGGGSNPNRYFVSGNKNILGEVNANGEMQWLIHQTGWIYRAYYYAELPTPDPISVTLLTEVPPLCQESDPVDLNSLVSAPGVVYFEGPGVSNGWFYPSESGMGNNEITYVYGDVSGTFNIQILPTQITFNLATICNGESILVGGAEQVDSGTYVDTTTTNEGCLAFLATTLTVVAGDAPVIDETWLYNGCISTWDAGVVADSYIWEVNGTEYLDFGQAINPHFITGLADVTGRVKYFIGGCESDWSDEVSSSCPVGISETPEQDWTVYPNPSAGVVRIQAPGTGGFDLTVSDLSGKVLLTRKNMRSEQVLDLPEAPGVYTLVLVSPGGQTVRMQVVRE